MSSQFQLGNSPESIFISIGKCQLDHIRGSPLGFGCGVSLKCLVVRSQLKSSFESIFEICHLESIFEIYHLTFDLKLFWN